MSDIATVSVGPELDALVAEHILGLTIVGICACWHYDGYYTIDVDIRADDSEQARDAEWRPVHAHFCSCDISPLRLDGDDPIATAYNDKSAKEFEEDLKRFGHSRHCLEAIPRYSFDIAAAWPIHQMMCEQIFSRRQAYFRALQAQTRAGESTLVAWPDVLVALRYRMPEAICRAALIAVSSDA